MPFSAISAISFWAEVAQLKTIIGLASEALGEGVPAVGGDVNINEQ